MAFSSCDGCWSNPCTCEFKAKPKIKKGSKKITQKEINDWMVSNKDIEIKIDALNKRSNKITKQIIRSINKRMFK